MDTLAREGGEQFWPLHDFVPTSDGQSLPLPEMVGVSRNHTMPCAEHHALQATRQGEPVRLKNVRLAIVWQHGGRRRVAAVSLAEGETLRSAAARP